MTANSCSFMSIKQNSLSAKLFTIMNQYFSHIKHNVVYWQRDVVSSYLDSGKAVDDQGIEDAFELLHEINERVRTGLWVGDCFIYNNSSSRLNYCVGGEVKEMLNFERMISMFFHSHKFVLRINAMFTGDHHVSP